MTTGQALRLEELCDRLNPSEGELLWLARQCSQDASLISLGHLSRADAEDLISTLESYERWLMDFSADTAQELMEKLIQKENP